MITSLVTLGLYVVVVVLGIKAFFFGLSRGLFGWKSSIK
jgi:hypothetical protein